MTKICLCVSGQMRASGAGLESLKRALDGHDATVIFSVWNRFGRKTAGAMNTHQLGRIFSADAVLAIPSRWIGWKAFSAALPNLIPPDSGDDADESDRIRDSIRAHFPAAIIDIEDGNLLDLSFNAKKEDSNSIRMLYKIWRANEIKRKIEQKHGRFDIVVRIRPDTVLKKIDTDLLLAADSDKTVFVNDFTPGGRFVGDTFAAGTSEAIDQYAGLFGHVLRDRDAWSFIHTEIHDHLVRQGLSYAKYPHCGPITPDQTLSAQAVAAYLADASFGPEGGTPLHRITREAMLASATLSEGNASADSAAVALDRLRGTPDGQDAADYDGCLAVLGTALQAAGRPFDAICCWLTARWVGRARGFHNPITAYGERLVGATVDGLIRFAGTDPDAGPSGFADRIASRMRPLKEEFPFLHRVIGSDEAEASVRAVIAAFVGEGSFGNIVMKRVAQPPSDKAARTNLMRAAGWMVSDVHTMYNIAHALKKARYYEDARFWQERATDLRPDHSGAQRQMAEIYFHLGDIDNGVRRAQEAYRLAPRTAEVALLAEYADFVAGRASAASPSHRPAIVAAPGDFRTLPRFDEFMASRDVAAAG